MLPRDIQAYSRAQGRLHRQQERRLLQPDASTRRGGSSDRRGPQEVRAAEKRSNG